MSDTAANIGHNNPPPPTPYELAAQKTADLYGEATLWLNGDVVESQALADGLANLRNMIGEARRFVEDARKTEKKPHDLAAVEVQKRYHPLLNQLDRAADACRTALTPWLQMQKDARDIETLRAQEEARIAREAADAALRASAGNIVEREAAEDLQKNAKAIEAAAHRLGQGTAKAGGDVGRAMSLRTTWTATLTGTGDAMLHYWGTQRGDVLKFLQTLADRDVRQGKRSIPGYSITQTERAV